MASIWVLGPRSNNLLANVTPLSIKACGLHITFSKKAKKCGLKSDFTKISKLHAFSKIRIEMVSIENFLVSSF